MPNPIVHFEIGCRDMAKTRDFYQSTFGWAINPANQIDSGGQGIPGHFVSLGHEPHHYTLFYIQVDDVAAYLQTVERHGGRKLVGPVNLPTGSFAWFQDPEGNTVGLWQS